MGEIVPHRIHIKENKTLADSEVAEPKQNVTRYGTCSSTNKFCSPFCGRKISSVLLYALGVVGGAYNHYVSRRIYRLAVN